MLVFGETAELVVRVVLFSAEFGHLWEQEGHLADLYDFAGIEHFIGGVVALVILSVPSDEELLAVDVLERYEAVYCDG